MHALELALPVAEIETPYYARPEGVVQQARHLARRFWIRGTILKLYRSEKAAAVFHGHRYLSGAAVDGLAIPVVVTYLEIGLVPRLPTAVLSMGLMIVASLSVSSGWCWIR